MRKSGRCTLQAVGYEVDMLVSRFPYRFPHRERDHASEKIWLERDRCIFCQRCVEFVRDEATGQKIFSISHRGPESRIEIDTERANAMRDEQIRYAVAICPVGAIIEKRVGSTSRSAGASTKSSPSANGPSAPRRARRTVNDEIASHEMPATPPDPALSAAREGKIKVAMIGLCGCWGCTLSFLDMDERIIPL